MKRKALFPLAAALSRSGPALADATVQVLGGGTGVELRAELTGALDSLGVGVSPERPASLRRGYASFPIPAGAFDLETASVFTAVRKRR